MVNLTCGRNPWKRACVEDSTFRAYLKDRQFLRTILPLSPELDAILGRVFECDPLQRISLQELRDLIVACPRLTNNTPPSVPGHYADTSECAHYALPPSPPTTPPPHNQTTPWSFLELPTKQASTCSSGSCDSGYHSESGYSGESSPCFSSYHIFGGPFPYPEVAVYAHQPPLVPPMIAVY